MKKINHKCIIPSAAYTIKPRLIKYYHSIDKPPEVGDVIYGEVVSLGQHRTLESKSARIHTIQEGSRAIFVLGNRYAPDYYESFIPQKLGKTIDLTARSGLIGTVQVQNKNISSPTKIKVLGYVCDAEENIINTRDYTQLIPKKKTKKKKRAKLILCIGTSMNSGKSRAAAASCYALSSMQEKVRAAKVTGTASLKDLLLMEDCGAGKIADFTYLGFPSTYMLPERELEHIFDTIDLKYGNNPANYFVVEFADGIMQRETAMLLKMDSVRARIHKIVFCGNDAFGILGGLRLLKDLYGLDADAISGVCTSSPLQIRELQEHVNLPILKSAELNHRTIYEIIK